jgi:LuxR family maltose regulon positive regulatory protein
LTIVSAAAGYGKTSALVDFARHSPMPVCWYTADERDHDLGVFVSYLVALSMNNSQASESTFGQR